MLYDWYYLRSNPGLVRSRSQSDAAHALCFQICRLPIHFHFENVKQVATLSWLPTACVTDDELTSKCYNTTFRVFNCPITKKHINTTWYMWLFLLLVIQNGLASSDVFVIKCKTSLNWKKIRCLINCQFLVKLD